MKDAGYRTWQPLPITVLSSERGYMKGEIYPESNIDKGLISGVTQHGWSAMASDGATVPES